MKVTRKFLSEKVDWLKNRPGICCKGFFETGLTPTLLTEDCILVPFWNVIKGSWVRYQKADDIGESQPIGQLNSFVNIKTFEYNLFKVGGFGGLLWYPKEMTKIDLASLESDCISAIEGHIAASMLSSHIDMPPFYREVVEPPPGEECYCHNSCNVLFKFEEELEYYINGCNSVGSNSPLLLF